MSTFEELNLESILTRVAIAARVKSGAAVAEALGVKPQTLANWKARGSIPYERLIDFADQHGLALDYLLLGREPRYRRRTEIDVRLLTQVAAYVRSASVNDEAKISFSLGQSYFFIGLVYNRLLRLPEEARYSAVRAEVDFMVAVLNSTPGGDALEVERKLLEEGIRKEANREK